MGCGCRIETRAAESLQSGSRRGTIAPVIDENEVIGRMLALRSLARGDARAKRLIVKRTGGRILDSNISVARTFRDVVASPRKYDAKWAGHQARDASTSPMRLIRHDQ